MRVFYRKSNELRRKRNMDAGYAVKAKFEDYDWTSEIYFDVQDFSDKLDECKADKRFSDVKMYLAYVHYEEIKEIK
jgi:hypothetical protein